MFFYFKKYKIVIFLVIILLLILAYVVNISSIPDNIILFNGNELALQTIAGIRIKQIVKDKDEQILETSTNIDSSSNNIRPK